MLQALPWSLCGGSSMLLWLSLCLALREMGSLTAEQSKIAIASQ